MMMVMTAKDEWVRAAMTDDTVVVELLVRLKQSPSPSLQAAKSDVSALRWGIRQPRSRSSRFDAVRGKYLDSASNNKTMRASPTTPLSWSGGGGGGEASPSGTIDALEETSRHQTSGVRSKSIATNETTSKRLRKKRTYAELKEEESLLLKESINLKKELETLRATYKEQSARNHRLKRMKLDLGLNHASESCNEAVGVIYNQVNKRVAASSSSHFTIVDFAQHQTRDSGLSLLPDLNMMPSEDDFGYGIIS